MRLSCRPNLLVASFAAFFVLVGWLAPNHYFPWTGFYNDAPVGIALILVTILGLCAKPDEGLLLPKYIWGLVLIPLLPLIQWIFGVVHFAGDAWLASLYLLGSLLAYICGHSLINSQTYTPRSMMQYMAWLFTIGSVISTFIALRQVLGQNGVIWEMELAPGGRPYANLSQPNQLATLLLIGIFSTAYLYASGYFGKVAFYFAAVFLALGLAMTQSRTPLITIALFVAWIHWRFSRSGRWADDWVISVRWVLIIYLAFWWFWPWLHNWGDGNSAIAVREMGDNPRLMMWRQFLDASLLKPIVGYGWNQASFAQLDVVADYPSSMLTFSSHNLFLDLVLWNGLPAGLLISASIAIWIWRHLCRCETLESWYALTAVMIVMVHAQFEFPLQYAYFLLPTSFIVGAIDATDNIKRAHVSKYFVIFLAAAGTIPFLGIVMEYPQAEEEIRHIRFQSAGITHAGKELSWEPLELRFLTQLNAFAAFSKSQAMPGMNSDEIENARLVSHRFPFPAQLFHYILALALNGRHEEAALELRRLRNLQGEKYYRDATAQLIVMRGSYPELDALELTE